MFKLEFETGDETFQDGMDGVDLWEVAAAIRSVAAWLRDGHREGAVLDVNGNAVGHYELSE